MGSIGKSHEETWDDGNFSYLDRGLGCMDACICQK